MNRSSYNWSTATKQSIAIMLVKKATSSSSSSSTATSLSSTSKLCSSAYTNQIINRRKLLTLPEITVQSADDPNDANDNCNTNNNNITHNNHNNNKNNNNNSSNRNNNQSKENYIKTNNNNLNSSNINSSSSNFCTTNSSSSNNNNNNNKINNINCKRINKINNNNNRNNYKEHTLNNNTGSYNNQDESINLEMTEKEEARNLQVEFEWVLRKEVHAIFKQLRTLLIECAHRFPVPLYDNEGKKTEKFVLTVSPEQLKAIVTLTGDTITQADISFKLAKAPHHIQRTSIIQESPWKLQQVQDAANYLQQAINHIDDVHDACCFKTSDEVLHIVGNILEALRHGRTSLVIPKKKSIDELIKGRNMKSLAPNLTEDLAVSFYLQSHKLIIAIYQLTNIQGTMRFDSYQAEASVQWLNEVLLMLTAALKLCQQLKDKISVFSLYKDFTVGSCAPPNLSCFEKQKPLRLE